MNTQNTDTPPLGGEENSRAQGEENTDEEGSSMAGGNSDHGADEELSDEYFSIQSEFQPEEEGGGGGSGDDLGGDDLLPLSHPTDGDDLQADGEFRRFDTALPSTHSYLGDLQTLAGSEDPNVPIFLFSQTANCVEIPLLQYQHVVLFPGDTLPMHAFGGLLMGMVQRLVDDNLIGHRTFGFLSSSASEVGQLAGECGTTAEICQVLSAESQQLAIVARGRQRFRVLSARVTSTELLGKVEILSDRKPCSIPKDAFVYLPERSTHVSSSSSVDDGGVAIDPLAPTPVAPSARFPQKRSSRRAVPLTPWPERVYRLFDCETLMRRAMGELVGLVGEDTQMPSDPVAFSFWLARALPVSVQDRQELLCINSVVERLRRELQILTRPRRILCRFCQASIGLHTHIFSMSKDGPSSAFVNPGGFVHDVLTLSKASNLTVIGSPCLQDSWFPGYAWTMALCRRCHHHMGWMFSAANLRPAVFFGLRRSELKFDVA